MVRFLGGRSYEIKYHDVAANQIIIELNVARFLRFKETLEAFVKMKIGGMQEKLLVAKRETPKSWEWEEITLRFRNGHEVEIHMGEQVTRVDFKEMGFVDKRTHLPDKQWKMLESLAQHNGRLAWQDHPGKNRKRNLGMVAQELGFEKEEDFSGESRSSGMQLIKAADASKKTKQVLASKLKAYFKKKDDPFAPYNKKTGYFLRLKLIPA